ncbi:hypothetical protein PHYC_00847 [Phycisphaerales bacterium]|nr:hypothetical protein PHYC_00847 [Phycisphaerales bacterium]
MKRSIVRSPAATRHLLDHFVYIGESSLQAADRFLFCVDRTLMLLADHPNIGRRVITGRRRLRSLRRWPVSGFRNFLIFYRADSKTLTVVGIYHGARDLDTVFGVE